MPLCTCACSLLFLEVTAAVEHGSASHNVPLLVACCVGSHSSCSSLHCIPRCTCANINEFTCRRSATIITLSNLYNVKKPHHHQLFLNKQHVMLHATNVCGAAAGGQSKVTPAASSSRTLATWAPVLLRAMYERNVRRPYCPSTLWLEPYHATCSSGNQAWQDTLSAEAIVRALLQAQSSHSM